MTPVIVTVPTKRKLRSVLLAAGLLLLSLPITGCSDNPELDAENVEPAVGNVVDVYAATNPTATPAPAFIIHGIVTPNPEVSWAPGYIPSESIQTPNQTPHPEGEPVEPEGTPPPVESPSSQPTTTPKPTNTPKPSATPKPTSTPKPSPGNGLSMLMPSGGGNIVYVSPTPTAEQTTPTPSPKPSATPTVEPTAKPTPTPSPT